MSQPPQAGPPPPQWRRPAGVAPGTWDYVHQWTIADHYDAFVADTPLCRLDLEQLGRWLPGCQGNRCETILDLGCGSGRAAIPLAEAGYEVIGVDLSRPMLANARRKTQSLPTGCGHVSLVHANLVQLECFGSQVAEHAICLFSTLGMIQGRSHRRHLLAEVARILRPGGRFVLHVHHRWAALREPAGLRQLASSWIKSMICGEAEFGDSTYRYRGIDQMFMHRFSRRELLRDLNAAGWTVSEICPLSIDAERRLPRNRWNDLRAGGYLVLATGPAA